MPVNVNIDKSTDVDGSRLIGLRHCRRRIHEIANGSRLPRRPSAVIVSRCYWKETTYGPSLTRATSIGPWIVHVQPAICVAGRRRCRIAIQLIRRGFELDNRRGPFNGAHPRRPITGRRQLGFEGTVPMGPDTNILPVQ